MNKLFYFRNAKNETINQLKETGYIMKQLFFASFLAFLFLNLSSFGQNLVLNPSFENISGCPVGPSELWRVINWDDANSGADSCSSPDIYASCAPQIGGVNSPNALLGYQPSRTGDKHAGIILFEGFAMFGCTPLFTNNYREYLQGTLSQSLTAGASYCVRFYINLANNAKWGTNSIGVYFGNSNTQYEFCLNSAPLPLTPQLQYTGPAIMDTVNWVLLQWNYVATGGEQYFIIGNFNDDANTPRVDNDCNGFHPYAYYFIDDVSVTGGACCPAYNLNVLSTINDTCGNGTGAALVGASGGVGPYAYSWSNGGTGALQQGLAAGNYSVTATDANSCQVSQSVTINQIGGVTLTISTSDASCTQCDGSATLSPSGSPGPYSYLWDSAAGNQTTATASNLCGGQYSVTVTDGLGCQTVALVQVNQPGGGGFSAIVTPTNASCGGGCDGSATVTAIGGTPPFTYQWSANAGSQSGATANNLCPGNYTVTVTESGGGPQTVVVWSEDFGTGCSTGTLAAGFVSTNGTWTVSNTGTNQAQANIWYVSAEEQIGSGNCGVPCGGSENRTLHLGAHPAVGGDAGAAYFESGNLICSFFGLCGITNKRAESPVINLSGFSDLTLSFDYIEFGEGTNDNATLWYYNGSTWSLLVDLPKTLCCGGTCTGSLQGLFTNYSIQLPASANNNPNVRIGFNWTNNGNDVGTDPSFAVDNIQLSIQTTGGSCPAVLNFNITQPNNTLNTSMTVVNQSCGQQDGSATVSVSGGTVPYQYQWSNGPTTAANTGLFAGTYYVTVTDAQGCTGLDTATITIGTPTGTPGLWTWLGVQDSNWFEPCNWDKFSIPDSLSQVYVPGGTPFNPVILGDTAWCQNITIHATLGGQLNIRTIQGGFLMKKP